jgi:hypothetical protein
MMVPAQIIAMLNAPNFSPKALGTLDMILSLGAPCSENTRRSFTRNCPEVL